MSQPSASNAITSPIPLSRLFLIVLMIGLLSGLSLFIVSNDGSQLLYLKALGILLHFMALGLMVFLRGSPLKYVGFWAALMLFLYHGLPELSLLAEEATTPYRIHGHVSLEASALASLYSGLFNFTMTGLYTLFASVLRSNHGTSEMAWGELWIDKISGTLLGTWIISAYLYQGGLRNFFGDGTVGYLLSSLLFYPLLPVLTLLFVKVIRDIGLGRLGRFIGLTILGILTIGYVFILNERISLLVALFSALYLTEAYQISRLKLRSLTITALVVVAAFAGLVLVRNSVGREAITSASPIKRIELVWNSLIRGEQGASTRYQRVGATGQVVNDFQYRTDSNGHFGKLITSTSPYARSVDWTPAKIALRLAIPSALWGSKLDLDLSERNVEVYLGKRFWFEDANYDYLPTPLSVIYGIGGTWGDGAWLLVFAALIGGPAFAIIEYGALRRPTLARVLVILTIMNCIVFIERDITQWTVSARNGMILLVVLGIQQVVIPRRFYRRRSLSCTSSGRYSPNRVL